MVTTSHSLLCSSYSFFTSKPALSQRQLPKPTASIGSSKASTWATTTLPPPPPTPHLIISSRIRKPVCRAARRKPATVVSSSADEGDDNTRRLLQIILWVAEGVYILWLFLLPYAPVSEGLFNFVIGWTFMFAPLLFTDRKRDRYKGSLDVLWGLQMFLTNTFLIPYMAIRMNEASADYTPSKRSQLGSVMTNGAPIVGLIGGSVCLISALWAVFGRMDSNFGSIGDRWEFLASYLGSERLAYAFIWDICFYLIFQPWLIGDNLQNVQESKVDLVNYLRFVPVVGLIAYLLCLNIDDEY
ncbi:uncharacterized protein LOC121242852 isoform X2 [Juglans microcarpa x Juglans regia]|uniref:uncharacterized protein LOC121242852 isoform X2 n=1 Tax=Juglans microcarpa x Juglans regia TaxID=2249226 RepID=UPI001B7DAD8E|nr:uncharacterized protein LOC121242852 isoform X2 [Juglans microcarpa x Juglans regia]